MEMIIAANNLPESDFFGVKPNTFAVLYVDLWSLDEFDKKTIGKLNDYQIKRMREGNPNW